MGIFGNILLTLISLPFVAFCLNGIFVWLKMGVLLPEKYVTLLTHPALISISFCAAAFGIVRIGLFIGRLKEKASPEAELQYLEDSLHKPHIHKDKGDL